jgi:hypothetical protein
MNNKILATVFAALVLLGGTVSAELTCDVIDTSVSPCADTTVFSMWSNTNSHAEIPTGTAYNWDVCCSTTTGAVLTATPGDGCGGETGVISLWSATNSHAEQMSGGASPNYGNDICLAITPDPTWDPVLIQFDPANMAVECVSAPTCAADYECVAAISGTGNAHVGDCANSDASYDRICCRIDSDGDGLWDWDELNPSLPSDPDDPASPPVEASNPADGDTDDDTLWDGVEVNGWTITGYNCVEQFLDPNKPAKSWWNLVLDPSLDFTVTSNPSLGDSDGDTLTDDIERAGWDVIFSENFWDPVKGKVDKRDTTLTGVLPHPRDINIDVDGKNDDAELNANPGATVPTVPDVDCDGAWDTNDGFEIDYGLNPLDSDTDGDGITDGLEIDFWLGVLGYDYTKPETIPEEALLKAVEYTKMFEEPAEVDIKPDTLNLKSRGKWITAYIEPFVGSAGDIDINTVVLEEVVPAVSNPKYDFVTDPSEYLVDHDGDGTIERMVKFNRAQVQELLTPSTAELTVSGSLSDGTAFSGTDTIRAIKEGREATSARIKEIAASLQNAGPGVKAGYLRNIADVLLWWYYSVVPADLTVGESDIVVSDPIEGQEVTIDVTVHNRGETDAGEFSVDFSVDGTLIGTDVLSLEGGSNAATRFTWIAENGAHDIEIVVDAADAVKELSEENNAASVKVVGKKK